MIVRRRRTKNFTILENEVVEDERLALDEIGLLTWLRSRPDHWEVSRAHIGKRFKIGRDKVARIFQSLIECGWMVREFTPPGVPARYVVCDEPGVEIEMTADELAEVEGGQREKNDSPGDTVADLSQSGFPSTGNSSAGFPPTENPAAIVRTDLKEELKPTQPSQGRAFNEDSEKRFQEFKSGYPDGIVDPEAAKREFAALTEPDQVACVAAVAVYAGRCRKRREKSLKAHLFIRKRSWEGLLASPTDTAAPQLYEPKSTAAQALRALGAVARYTPLTMADGRLSHRGEITARLLAMADIDDDAKPATYKMGSPNFRAWWNFIREVFKGCNLPALMDLSAPWPWPPSVTGSIYSGSDPPPLVPGTLATDEDLSEMSREICGQ
jgi:hypothetical protein